MDKPIGGIGHRVVQGGWYFPESAVVTDETLARVREVAPLAPLHNYAEADVIEICRDMFPELGNVIVPDTAFHYNMPERAWRYALPRDVVDTYHVRKYGAHGTSSPLHLAHRPRAHGRQDAQACKLPLGLRRVPLRHRGRPVHGHHHGSYSARRSHHGHPHAAHVDPATVFYLNRVGGYSIDDIDTMMNKQSGLLAVSGVSSDSRDIEDGAAQRATRTARWRSTCSTTAPPSSSPRWHASMEGVDTMAFTAGIGENSPEMRAGVRRSPRLDGRQD